MIERDELIRAAIQAFQDAPLGSSTITAIIDAIEPMIREDQRAMTEMEEIGDVLRADRAREQARLRKRVLALPTPVKDKEGLFVGMVWLQDVLRLLGEPDTNG